MKKKVSGSIDGDLAALTWLDLCGIARVGGIPLKHLKGKEEFGLSFPSAAQAMTMFGGIVDNPWGSLGDVRQRPIMSTLMPPSSNGLQIVLSEAMGSDGGVWHLCTRTLLKNVIAEYERELGWKPFATFEHEFRLFSETMVPPL
jgi:glutamine synthetase